MSFLSKELELHKFINSKILPKKQINYKKILYYLTKALNDSSLKCYKRLNNFHWIEECNTIVFNIFWTVFTFTYNVKLTLFLCERAVMLFNEYIDLAKHTFKDNNQQFKINSTDVKLFIYKRTIGPITIKKQSNKFKRIIRPIKKAGYLINLLINKLICMIINLSINQIESILEKNLNYFEQMIPDIFYKIYQNKLYYNLDLHNCYIIENEFEIIQFIHKIKFDCEILYFIFKILKSQELSQKLFIKLIESNTLDTIDKIYFTQSTYNSDTIKYIKNNINKFKQLNSK